jgi:hypothetical protein
MAAFYVCINLKIKGSSGWWMVSKFTVDCGG